MIRLLIIISALLLSSGAYAQENPYPLSKLNWLQGDWSATHGGNQLELHLSGTEGGVMLSTYKLLRPTGDLLFMRFMSLQDAGTHTQLHLYPYLRASSDVFNTVEMTDEKVVFERVYENAECAVADAKDSQNDNEELQMKCDRFPIQITFTKNGDDHFEEYFYGFKPKDGKQSDVSFKREYTKK